LTKTLNFREKTQANMKSHLSSIYFRSTSLLPY